MSRTRGSAVPAVIDACSMSDGSEKEDDSQLDTTPTKPNHNGDGHDLPAVTNGQHTEENGHAGDQEGETGASKEVKEQTQRQQASDEDEQDNTNSDDDDDDDDDEDEDEEPRLKYTKLTGSLATVYRNGDATSALLLAGDKMVCAAPHRILFSPSPALVTSHCLSF